MDNSKDILGNITLYNADCMDLLRQMPDKAYDLAIVDPPYGDAEIGGGGIGLENDLTATKRVSRTGGTWATKYGGGIIGWDVAPTHEYFEQLFRITKHQIVWGANYFPNMPPTRCFIVWEKYIPENFTMAMCEYAWTSFVANAKVFKCAPQGRKNDVRFHPTQKPVALYKWLLTNYAKEGDRILDTHLGSGSIAIACHDLGFELTGIELDPDYYAKAVHRIREHQRQLTLI